MSLVASYVVYDDLSLLRRSLKFIVGKVDMVVVVHGVFKGFGEPVDRRDGIRGMLESLKFDYKLIYKPEWSSIFEGTTQMFKYGSEGDYVLTLATDEFVMGDMSSTIRVINANPDKEVFYARWFLEGLTGMVVQRPRIFKWQKGLHFDNNDVYLYDAEGRLVDGGGFGGDNVMLVPLIIVHLPNLHTPRYKKLKREWRRKGGDTWK